MKDGEDTDPKDGEIDRHKRRFKVIAQTDMKEREEN